MHQDLGNGICIYQVPTTVSHLECQQCNEKSQCLSDSLKHMRSLVLKGTLSPIKEKRFHIFITHVNIPYN